MKKILIVLIAFVVTVQLNAQVKKDSILKIVKPTLVDASCGQCQFGLKTQKGCDLAVKINGIAYFVDSTKIDDHGDAHSKDGFCNAIRKAEIQGKLVNNRFVATSFKLLTYEEVKKIELNNKKASF
jgi:hypothetical protein